MIGICKELEATAANGALEVVFEDISGPLRIEEVPQRTGAFGHYKNALTGEEEKSAGELQILTRLLETQTLHEAVALWAGRHWNSLTPGRWRRPMTKVQG